MGGLNVTPQSLAQWRLFNPSPNPLYSFPGAPGQSDPSQATPAPTPSPAANGAGQSPSQASPTTPTASTPASASANPATGASLLYGAKPPQLPESEDEFSQLNPSARTAYMPPRPVGDFDTGAHPTLRRALANAFAGLAEFGGDINHHPGAGEPYWNRWENQDLAQKQYDQPGNQERMQAGALHSAYQNYLQQQQERAGTGLTGAQTGLTGAQTQNLTLNPPGKADFLKELQQRRATGADDPQQLFNEYAVRAPYAHATRQEVLDIIKNTPVKPFNFEVKEGAIQPGSYLGHTYGPEGGENEPPEIAAARKNALQTIKQGQQGKEAVARAEGAARAQIETNMLRGSNPEVANVAPRQVASATSDAQKADADYAQAQSVSQRLAAIMDAAKRGNVVSYQLLPEEGALQVTTSQGVHRINMAEIQNYGGGSLWQKLEGHIGGALTGKSIPPSVLTDMAEMQQIQEKGARSKYENVLKGLNQRYGSNFQPVTMNYTENAQPGNGSSNSPPAGGNGKNPPVKPQGATHIGVGSLDKKKHYLDDKGNDLGLAE